MHNLPSLSLLRSLIAWFKTKYPLSWTSVAASQKGIVSLFGLDIFICCSLCWALSIWNGDSVLKVLWVEGRYICKEYLVKKASLVSDGWGSITRCWVMKIDLTLCLTPMTACVLVSFRMDRLNPVLSWQYWHAVKCLTVTWPRSVWPW